MKKSKLLFSGLAFFFILAALPAAFHQKQEQLQEKVTVTAAEIPVRVLQDGQPVKGLTKDDFELFENGIPQRINAFETVSRKVSAPQALSQQDRLFILIFNIFDYNDEVGEAIDYFFENFFRPNCRIIIVVEDRLLNIPRGQGVTDLILSLKETLKKYKQLSTLDTYRAFDRLNAEAERILGVLRIQAQVGADVYRAIINFYESYHNIWIAYRKQFLAPDLALYQSIVERAKHLGGEKWAICFQQREMFPMLKHQSSLERTISEWVDGAVNPQDQINARFIRAKQMDMQRDFNISSAFPADDLRRLFMEANITFHLVLLRSLRTLGYQDFELREVAQDYEACFKDISRSTGGLTVFSNKAAEALADAALKEDYFYLLVYSPEDNEDQKERDIEVRVKREEVEVVYLDSYSPVIKTVVTIADVQASRKNLKFSIIDYERRRAEGKLAGLAEVKITLFDSRSNKVFEEQKMLEMIEKETHISLNFNKLESGSYFAIIQVKDMIAQKTDVFSGLINL